MGIAFENLIKEIEGEKDIHKKQRIFLKEYEGMHYSKAEEGMHFMKWKTEPKKYRDSGFDPQINCIKELPSRTRIEFDGNTKEEIAAAKEAFEITKAKLKGYGFGFIQTTHNSKKTDYLWVEFNRDLTPLEKEAFLLWIAPKDSKVDLSFASDKKVFAVMFAMHWKYPYEREEPVEIFNGEKIDFDELDIPPIKQIKTKPRGVTVRTSNKNGLVEKIVSKLNISDLAEEWGIHCCPICGRELKLDDSRGFFCCEDSRYNCDFKGNIVEFARRCRP